VYFKQFYLGCLAHASYLIGSEGDAVVVDPRRDVDDYLAEARANGLRIRYEVEKGGADACADASPSSSRP